MLYLYTNVSLFSKISIKLNIYFFCLFIYFCEIHKINWLRIITFKVCFVLVNRVEFNENLRTEPKFIVFISHLLSLFKFCPACKANNPLNESEEVGTMAIRQTSIRNPKCPNLENTWSSQPLMPHTKMPGNVLLCLTILLAGGSAYSSGDLLLASEAKHILYFFNGQRYCYWCFSKNGSVTLQVL